MRSLKELQETLLEVILKPLEPNAFQDRLESLVKGSCDQNTLDRMGRVAIYGEAFYGRLHQIMEVEYPALHSALDDDLFHYFVTEYLKKYPPSSYTLNDLGKHFPGFLRETRPEDNEEHWPEFIIELAILERTFQEVFNSKGDDLMDLVDHQDFQLIQQEGNSVLLNFTFPVHEYFLAFRKENKANDIPDPRRVNVLVYRRNFQVRLMSQDE